MKKVHYVHFAQIIADIEATGAGVRLATRGLETVVRITSATLVPPGLLDLAKSNRDQIKAELCRQQRRQQCQDRESEQGRHRRGSSGVVVGKGSDAIVNPADNLVINVGSSGVSVSLLEQSNLDPSWKSVVRILLATDDGDPDFQPVVVTADGNRGPNVRERKSGS